MKKSRIWELYSLSIRIMLLSAAIWQYLTLHSYSGILLLACWVMLAGDMLFRIIPNKKIPYGARKHFEPGPKVKATSILKAGISAINKKAAAVAVTFAIINAAIFPFLTFERAVILMLIYSICDVAFILFFCPFQKFFMHNKCCNSCRIYNWDYAMMVTPLLLFPSPFSISLIIMASVVLIRWEVAVYKNPALFFEEISCAKCRDRLCFIKR